MKFSQSQIDLLTSYLSDMQIEEIKAFVPVLPDDSRCSFIKKNGEKCKNRKKSEELCNVHNKKAKPEVVSEVVPENEYKSTEYVTQSDLEL